MKTKKLKYLVTKLGSGKTPRGGAEVYVEKGIMLLRSQNIHFDGLRLDDVVHIEADVDEEMAATRVQPQDVLLNITGASIGRCTVVPNGFPRANVNQHVCILRPDQKLMAPEFLNWALQSQKIQNSIRSDENGTSREGLNFEQVGSFEIPVPSLKQQQTILKYLNQSVSKIELLINEKQSLLSLLTEKRGTLTTEAVTRGLNPTTKLKNSGLSWLGKIPAHWQLKRLKFLADVRGGLTLGKDYGQQELEEFPYLRVANVQDGFLNLNDISTIMVPATEAQSCMLQSGDVLMNEGGDIDKLGRGCVWRNEISNCLHQNHVFCVRPFAIKSEWLDAWTSGNAAKTYFENHAKRATNLASISSSNIKELPVAIPPEEEQTAILNHIFVEMKKIDELIHATRNTMNLLHEHRSSLISAAIEGQLRITATAKEPTIN